MRSAEPMNQSAVVGSAPKRYTRECSKYRPTRERTRIVADWSGICGRRQQMPRTMRSIGVPARDVSYISSMRPGSTKLFIFMMMRAVRPERGSGHGCGR